MKGRLPRWVPPSRWPLAAWIALAVTAGHLLLFWWVADKHFLPKVPHLAALKPPDFSTDAQVEIDPKTGEKWVRREYTVSTRLPTPLAESPTPTGEKAFVPKTP